MILDKNLTVGKVKCQTYEDHDIKQCHTVEYLECHVDSNLSCESMGIKFLENQWLTLSMIRFCEADTLFRSSD